jgi:hypothetical protein
METESLSDLLPFSDLSDLTAAEADAQQEMRIRQDIKQLFARAQPAVARAHR